MNNTKEKIIVDTSQELIPLNQTGIGNWFLLSDVEAENLTQVSHYTEVKYALKILKTQQFVAKRLSLYQTEKDFYNENNNFSNIIFTCSFTDKMQDDWDIMKKIQKSSQACKIEFYFKSSFKQAFDGIKPLNCIAQNKLIGKLRRKDGEQIENMLSEEILIKTDYQTIKVQEKLENNSIITVIDQKKDYYNAYMLGSSVAKRFEAQNEIRIKLSLKSVSRQEIPCFDKIMLPFNIDEVERIVIKMHPRASQKAKNSIREVVDNKKIYIVL